VNLLDDQSNNHYDRIKNNIE